MAKRALEARRQLADGLDAGLDEAIAAFDAVSKVRPGTFPLGDFSRHRTRIEQVCAARPGNLTARLVLAEIKARANEDASGDFVSIIREARPSDLFKGKPIDASIFAPASIRDLIWHSIDTGNQFVEGQRKTSRILAPETLKAMLPDFTGKSVLDIGTFGGWFSFEAERRGASSVTAAEYYSWITDFPRIRKWVASRIAAGEVANAYSPPADCYDVDAQPGRLAFDLTRHAFGSSVHPKLGRFEDTEFDQHDIVLLLGVLYHQENPYWMLEKCAALTRDTLIIETLGIHAPAYPDASLWDFYGSGQTRGDGSTFWAPTEQGLIDMLTRVGFRDVEVMHGADEVADYKGADIVQCRFWVHAHK